MRKGPMPAVIYRSHWTLLPYVLAGVLLLGSTLASTNPAHAWVLQSGQWAGDPANIGINRSGITATENVSEDQWRAALDGAVSIWNAAADVSGARIHLFATDDDAPVRIEMTDADSVTVGSWYNLAIDKTHDVCDAKHCDNAFTLPYYCEIGGLNCHIAAGPDLHTLDGAIVVVNTRSAWETLDEPQPTDSLDPETMFLHELGHVLGLGHSGNQYLDADCSAVMFGGRGCEDAGYLWTDKSTHYGAFVRRSLPVDDICGFRVLYATPCVGGVRGLVVANGGGAPGAVVTVAAANGESAQTATDNNGYYSFEDVPIGQAEVLVTADGYNPAEATVSIEDGAHALLPDITLSSVSTPVAQPTSPGRLLYQAFDPRGAKHLFVFDPSDGSTHDLLAGSAIDQAVPSPSGELVAVTTAPNGGAPARLFVINPHSNAAPTATTLQSPAFGNIAWTSDGARLAVATGEQGPDASIVVYSVASSTSKVVVRAAGRPAWSPDGRQLAYHPMDRSLGDAPNAGLWVLDVDTGAKRQVARGNGTVFSVGNPQWSHDGKWISFARSYEGATYEVIHATGGSPVLSGPNKTWWGPTGAEIAVATMSGNSAGPIQIRQSPDGPSLFACCGDGGAYFAAFDPPGRRFAVGVEANHLGGLGRDAPTALFMGGLQLIGAAEQQAQSEPTTAIHVADATGDRVILRESGVSQAETIGGLAWSSDGSVLAVGRFPPFGADSSQNRLLLLDPTGTVLRQLNNVAVDAGSLYWIR